MPSSHGPFNNGSMLNVIYKYLFSAISLSFIYSQFNSNERFVRFVSPSLPSLYTLVNTQIVFSVIDDVSFVNWNKIKYIRVLMFQCFHVQWITSQTKC